MNNLAPSGSFYCTFSYSPGGKFQMPEDYLALDGNSLSTDDLRQLGKGRYKIRITKGLSMSNYPKFYLIYIQILSKIKFLSKSTIETLSRFYLIWTKLALNHRYPDLF